MEDTVPERQQALEAADFTAALAWWREAGVDLDFADRPTVWLADTAPAGPVPASSKPEPPGEQPAPAAPMLGGDPASWPTDLAAFAPWWLSEPSLDDGQVRDRIAPRGPAGAELMIIVPQPEAGDTDQLLSGPEGQLLEAILAAMGVTGADAYIASALPRHTPLVDWPALASRGAGALLAHHVRLVAPRRIIAFGGNILPLLGHHPAQNAQPLPSFKHEGGTVPLLIARDLGAMLARPAWKAAFWRNWLDWTGTATA